MQEFRFREDEVKVCQDKFGTREQNIRRVKIVTYSGLATNSFSKFVKVNKELLNSDSILCH
jgi:hypothetical protein